MAIDSLAGDTGNLSGNTAIDSLGGRDDVQSFHFCNYKAIDSDDNEAMDSLNGTLLSGVIFEVRDSIAFDGDKGNNASGEGEKGTQ